MSFGEARSVGHSQAMQHPGSFAKLAGTEPLTAIMDRQILSLTEIAERLEVFTQRVLGPVPQDALVGADGKPPFEATMASRLRSVEAIIQRCNTALERLGNEV